jgi:hypothetical protein
MADSVIGTLQIVESDLEVIAIPTQSSNPTLPVDHSLAILISTTSGFNPATYIDLYKVGIAVLNTNVTPTVTPGSTTSDGIPAGSAACVQTILKALYGVPFIETLGKTTLATLIGDLQTNIAKLAEILNFGGQDLSADIACAQPALLAILNALNNIPGSGAEMQQATNALTEITGLLSDIPMARLELYAIAQQIGAIGNLFANTNP